MWKNYKIFLVIILSLNLLIFNDLIFTYLANAQAVENENNEDINPRYDIKLDQPTIAKGYTVSAFNDALKLSLTPGILSEATAVEVIELNEEIAMPWKLERISKVYQFEFINKSAYDDHKPFYIQFSYDKENNDYKQVFFYDKNYSAWRPLPTKDYPEEKFVRSLIHLPFARIAVFSYPGVLTVGRASWYKYEGGNFAASPDFPKGSIIRVYNNENNKFVDVKINDYGPDRGAFPDRAIDLDKAAFSRLASTGQGVINIRLEPLYIVPESGRVLGIANTGASIEPVINSKSAIIMDEQSGEVLWEKKATTTLPVASLTKLVAIKTFLDTKPSLDRVVEYKIQDEEYNYLYCEKWESARLRVNDGDSMTIEDLLYASLVGSANNTVESLVRVSGLSRDNFVKKMNELVAGWGATSTHFIEPSGLAPENVSSASDYSIIAKNVFSHPIIQKASTMSSYTFSTINTEITHRIKNTNKIINKNKFNITGSKTGFLNEAGYCLVVRIKTSQGREIIVVVLGSETRDENFQEVEELIKYGVKKLSG